MEGMTMITADRVDATVIEDVDHAALEKRVEELERRVQDLAEWLEELAGDMLALHGMA